ncbi:MAG TPA: site-2 protease family protein [Opitutaceae bacterium]|jgi:Zn-dependent protease
MFGWSINLFRIGGIRLAVNWTFGGLLAYFAYAGWQESGLPGLFWGAGTLIAYFACVVLHELGHSLTAMRFGVKVRRILLTPIGGIAEFDRIPRKPIQELLVTLAGPAVNFVIAGLLWAVVGLPENAGTARYALSLTGLAQTLVVWNIVMGLFNSIPAFPMDGGRVLRALLAFRLDYVRATYWAAMVGKIITVVGAIYLIDVVDFRENPEAALTVGICIFIFFAGQAEYMAVRRSAEREARWREALSRPAIPVGNPASEPPVLGP